MLHQVRCGRNRQCGLGQRPRQEFFFSPMPKDNSGGSVKREDCAGGTAALSRATVAASSGFGAACRVSLGPASRNRHRLWMGSRTTPPGQGNRQKSKAKNPVQWNMHTPSHAFTDSVPPQFTDAPPWLGGFLFLSVVGPQHLAAVPAGWSDKRNPFQLSKLAEIPLPRSRALRGVNRCQGSGHPSQRQALVAQPLSRAWSFPILPNG